MFWDELYRQIENLDVENDQWVHAEAFIHEVQALIERRKAWLKTKSSLEKALQNLSTACADELAYCQLESLKRLSADQFPWRYLTDTLEAVTVLQATLVQHGTVRQSQASTRPEETARKASLDSLYEEIVKLCRKIEGRACGVSEASAVEKKSQESEPSPKATTDDEVPPQLAVENVPSPPPPVSPRSPAQSGPPQPPFHRGRHKFFRQTSKDETLQDLTSRGVLSNELADKLRRGEKDGFPVDGPDETDGPSVQDQTEIGVRVSDKIDQPNPPEGDTDTLGEQNASHAESSPEEGHTETPPPETKSADDRHVSLKDTSSATTADTSLSVLNRESEPQLETVGIAHESQSDVQANHKTEHLFQQLVRQNDLAGAYWICRSLEEARAEGFFPSWLIAAIEAARCDPSRNRAIADDLLCFTTSKVVPQNEPCQMLALAAAIYPSLTNPESNSPVWLNHEATAPSLRRLVCAIADFSKHGRALGPDDIGERFSREEIETNLRNAAQAAETWLSNAPSHHTKLRRANLIWLKLIGPGGELHSLLGIAARDARAERAKLAKGLAAWRHRSEVVTRLRQLDIETNGRRVRPFQASPRDQIVSWIFEAGSIADEWYKAVERFESSQSGSSWIDEQVSRVVRTVQDNLEGAINELQSMIESDDVRRSTAGLCLVDSLRRLGRLLDCPGGETAEDLLKHDFERFVLKSTGDIHQRLRTRLWLLPDIELDSDGNVTTTSLSAICSSLAHVHRQKSPVRDLIVLRMEKQDFRYARTLMEELDEGEWTTANQRYENLLAASRDTLTHRLAAIEVEIEKAISDGVIMHTDRAEYQGIVSGITPEAIENFAREFEKLDAIQNDLRSRRELRLASQRADWQEQQQMLLQRSSAGVRVQIKAFVDRALEDQDTRIVDECISRLKEAEHNADEPKIDWFREVETPRDVLAEFVERCPELERSFSRSEAGIHQILGVLGKTRTLPRPREDEANKALTGWRKLRQGTPRNSEYMQTYVARILAFLGLQSVADGAPITHVSARSDWAHFVANVSAGNLSLVPQFGSQRAEQYDIVCLWERPGAQTLGARIAEAGLAKQPTIVLYLGRLNRNQRVDLARYCNRESLQIIVIDQLLLAFLVGERDARFPITLAAALPFAAINPYAPHGAGNVPPEMFFGRNRMNHALQDFSGNGSCLVYGGRQLGKSALLRRVQREFHRPDQHRYAIYEDIRLIGDAYAGQSAEMLWIRVRDHVNRLNLFAKPLTTEKEDVLIQRLLQVLASNTQMRILLLLDEADSFLEQDAEQQFSIVSHLKRLMEDSQRRFKVVFAGLHNVQRFQGIPNQPFAHLGIPLQVGPLDPQAAQNLVKTPFEAAGYRFSDDSLILKILSYTNYHPGLIQLFCSKLLDALHRKTGRVGIPPYTIDIDDIQAVYSNRKLEHDIRDRFDWTLALDRRYQAIAWSIIEDQFEDRDSFSRPYSSREVRELVNEYWPSGFRRISSDGLRGLLDEMCGLGVLVRADEGYRLRSPNLVHLMGTREEMFSRLCELSEKDSITRVFNADVHRASIGSGEYSPFTHSQARFLTAPRVGACLIFGSDALGLEHAGQAVSRFIPTDLPKGILARFDRIPDKVLNGEHLNEWLQDYWHQHLRYTRLFVMLGLHRASCVSDVVRYALDFCRKHRKRQSSWIRVFLVFDPSACWNWSQVADQTRKSLEDRADSVVELSLWTREAIHYRLNANQKMDNEAICDQVERVTGGWPFLLDELFKRCGTVIDPRPAIEQIEMELGEGKQLCRDFRDSLGINDLKEPRDILNLVKSLDEAVDQEMLLQFAAEEGFSFEDASSAIEFLVRLNLLEQNAGLFQMQPQVNSLLDQR